MVLFFHKLPAAFRGSIFGIIWILLLIAAFISGKWWVAGIVSLLGLGFTLFVFYAEKLIAEDIQKKCVQREKVVPAETDLSKVPLEWKPVLGHLFDSIRDTGLSKKTLSNLLEQTPVPLLVMDFEGSVLWASQGLEAFIKRTSQEIQGKKVTDLFRGDEATCFHQAMEKKDFVQREIRDGTFELLISTGRDESGNILGWFAVFLEKTEARALREKMEHLKKEYSSYGSEINELSQRVASASEEVFASTEEQAKGAMRQKEQTDTVATAMEEMAATVLEVAQNASDTSKAAQEIQEEARKGEHIIQEAVNGINTVSQSAHKLSKELEKLDEQADSISKVLVVINDIADQTNLLALNAAIEAARAGEAGKGFAVVADEVRKLAEKTMSATKEVAQVIRAMQTQSREAVESMDKTSQQVQSNTELTNQAGETFGQIMGRIDEMVKKITQIATAAEEQSSATSTISENVEEIALIAKDGDEAANQTAGATRELAELSQQLVRISTTQEESLHGDDSGAVVEQSVGHPETPGESKSTMEKVPPLVEVVQEYIRMEYGDSTYDEVAEAMSTENIFPREEELDQELIQVTKALELITGQNVSDILSNIARAFLARLRLRFGQYFEGKTLKQFYLSLNEVFSSMFTSDLAHFKSFFSFEDKGDHLFINCKSPLGQSGFFEEFLHGAAELFEHKVEVVLTELDEKTTRATVHFS